MDEKAVVLLNYFEKYQWNPDTRDYTTNELTKEHCLEVLNITEGNVYIAMKQLYDQHFIVKSLTPENHWYQKDCKMRKAFTKGLNLLKNRLQVNDIRIKVLDDFLSLEKNLSDDNYYERLIEFRDKVFTETKFVNFFKYEEVVSL